MRVPIVLVAAAAVLFLAGSYYGLAVAPPEQFMGEVQRIMYVHVPTAWGAMLALSWAFACAVAWLFSGRLQWDHRLDAAVEMSVVLCFLLSVQGAIWAKPTWGVWWDWDPRLTTVAILLMAFLGIAALRRFVDDPVRRATWSAVATVVGFIDVPIVYYSVKWWNSLHQQQSSAGTVSGEFRIPLLLNFIALMLFVAGVMIVRARAAAMRAQEELPPEPPLLPDDGEKVPEGRMRGFDFAPSPAASRHPLPASGARGDMKFPPELPEGRMRGFDHLPSPAASRHPLPASGARGDMELPPELPLLPDNGEKVPEGRMRGFDFAPSPAASRHPLPASGARGDMEVTS